MNLFENVTRWIGRVEVVLAGGSDHYHRAVEALRRQDYFTARAQSLEVLLRVPHSPHALSVFADACDGTEDWDDAHKALTELLGMFPSRPELYLRRGLTAQRLGRSADESSEDWIRALPLATGELRQTLLKHLVEIDLRTHRAARALAWTNLAIETPTLTALRMESLLELGRLEEAKGIAISLSDDPPSATGSLAKGKVLRRLGDRNAYVHLVRAWLLDAPGALDELAAGTFSLSLEPSEIEFLRTSVFAAPAEKLASGNAAAGTTSPSIVAAASDSLRGEHARARSTLTLLAETSEEAAIILFSLAARERDRSLLEIATKGIRDPLLRDNGERMTALLSDPAFDPYEHPVSDPRLGDWIESVLEGQWKALLEGAPRWSDLQTRIERALRVAAPEHGDFALLEGDTSPLSVVVAGEFNAGKSTFINALVGENLSPVGILPTTAMEIRLQFGLDRFAIWSLLGERRIVPAGEMREILRALEVLPEHVDLYLPLPLLRNLTIVDTPGLNAPDPRHSASAKRALASAEMVLWVLDASQPLKESERDTLLSLVRERIPIVFVLNKADRFSNDDLAQILSHVKESLATIGVPFVGLVPCSAKRALEVRTAAPRSTDEDPFRAVDDLLEAVLFSKKTALRDRTRKRVLLSRLQTVLAEGRQPPTMQDGENRWANLRARLLRDLETLIESMEGALKPDYAAFLKEIAPILADRTATTDARERFRIESAESFLGNACMREALLLCREGSMDRASEKRLQLLLRAVVRSVSPTDGDDLSRLARAFVTSLADWIGSEAELDKASHTTKRIDHTAKWAIREISVLERVLQADLG
ncbi:MAG: dynamin family protein [Polyangiaceae bacterium]|nr:dynamin family protein [Polyangiaceae bacterium]